jgi:hypothetical protein
MIGSLTHTRNKLHFMRARPMRGFRILVHAIGDAFDGVSGIFFSDFFFEDLDLWIIFFLRVILSRCGTVDVTVVTSLVDE